jgi:uncharacterized protein YjgD (DUF1641 family)
MQCDVIVRIICISKIVKYLKNEASRENLEKYLSIVIYLYNTIIKSDVKFRWLSILNNASRNIEF